MAKPRTPLRYLPSEHRVWRGPLVALGSRFENWLVGPLEPAVQHNMRVELAVALALGVFWTALLFVPVILRRLGASAEVIAFYTASSYLGNAVSAVGLLLARPGHTRGAVVVCWFAARTAFLAAALVTGPGGILALAAFYWLMDALPTPIYSAILQNIYPIGSRGRIMGLVRLIMAIPMLVLAPVAGWILDQAGYRVLLPLAGLFGGLSALIFTRIRMDQGAVGATLAAAQSTVSAGDLVPAHRGRGAGRMWDIVARDRGFALWLLGLTVFGLSSLMPNPLFPLVQVDRLHLSYEDLGWLNLAQSVARLISYLYWGRLIDRWGAVRCVQAVFLINVAVALPYIWATQGWMLLPSFIAVGLVNSGLDLGYLNGAIQLAQGQRIPEYSALQTTVLGLRGLAGPFVGVALFRLGLAESEVFALCGALTLLAALILQWVRRPKE